MDNLTLAILPWGLGLTLFSALWAAEWLSARRHRRRLEKRLEKLTSRYGLSDPNIPKPYQRRVR